MDVAQQPVFLLHIRAGFDIDVAAARKCSNEQISLVFLAGNRVVVWDSPTSPVNLHNLTRFMRYAHRCLCYTSPAAVLTAELCTHVRYLTVRISLFAVFLPEKCKRYALL